MAKKLNTPLRKAYEDNDHITWSTIMARQGDIMPQDDDVLRSTFLLAKAREIHLPMADRIEARQALIDANVLSSEDDEPIKPSEKLRKAGSKMLVPGSAKQTLKDNPDYDEFVLVFPNENVRNVLLMRWANELQGMLDKVRSNVRYFELYTLDNKHIRFVVDDENYDLPIADVAFREISNAS